MKTKTKKLTKKQLLDEIIRSAEEEQKIQKSSRRLSEREERQRNRHKKLAQELHDLCYEERKKAAVPSPYTIPPIIYKQRVFAVSGGGLYNRAKCSVKEVNRVT